MKKFAVTLFFASIMTANASDSKIYDLMYLPKQGTNFGITELSIYKGLVEEKAQDYDYKGDITGWNFQQAIGRSITDNLLISADINYLHQDTFSRYVYNDFSPTDEDGSSVKGVGDPSINGRLRIIESEIQLDILGSVLFATGNKIYDGSLQNNKQGGNEVSLGAQAGIKMEDIQVSAGFGITRSLKSTDEDKDYKTKVKNDEHNSYLSEFSGLAKLTDETFLKVLAGCVFSDEYKDNSNGKAASFTQLYAGGELQLLINQDFLLRAGGTVYDFSTAGLDTYRILILNGAINYQF
jgi:hypothetical protein